MSLVYVDNDKNLRADEIVGWLTGTPTKDDRGAELKEKFAGLVSAEKVDKKNYKEFVYRKLGGLVRTVTEQKVAVEKAKAIRKALKKGNKIVDDDE